MAQSNIGIRNFTKSTFSYFLQ